MKKYLSTFLTSITLGLAAIQSVNAQSSCNLITNGNFETANVTSLSGMGSNVTTAINPNPQNASQNELASWVNTNAGTVDYFNTSAPTGTTTNPNASSYIGAFTPFGNGSLGMAGYQAPSNRPTNLKFSEYATQLLTQPMDDRYSYYISMQVSRASNVKYSTKVGLYVTTYDPKNYNGTDYIENPPLRITYPTVYTVPASTSPTTACGIESTDPIRSTQWSLLSGVVPGVAGAQYVNIGNFHPDDAEPIVGAATQALAISYTLIDNVEIYRIPTAGPNVSCSGAYVTLGDGCNIPGATYEWVDTSNPTLVFDDNYTTGVYVYRTTTFALKVYLPDGSTYVSYATVQPCPAPAVTGPNAACPGTALTYTATPNTPYVYWTATPANLFTVSSGSGNTFTTAPVAGATGTGTITAKFYYLPNQDVITKTINIGSIPRPQITALDPNPCYMRTVSYAISNYDPAYSYTIRASTGGAALPGAISAVAGATPGTTRSFPFRIKTGSPGYTSAQFTVTATGSCGSSSASGTAYFTYCISDELQSSPTTAYPNPTSESLTIPMGATDAILLNNQGKIVGYQDASGKFDVHALPAGLYNLQMQQDGKLINQHIEVKH